MLGEPMSLTAHSAPGLSAITGRAAASASSTVAEMPATGLRDFISFPSVCHYPTAFDAWPPVRPQCGLEQPNPRRRVSYVQTGVSTPGNRAALRTHPLDVQPDV